MITKSPCTTEAAKPFWQDIIITSSAVITNYFFNSFSCLSWLKCWIFNVLCLTQRVTGKPWIKSSITWCLFPLLSVVFFYELGAISERFLVFCQGTTCCIFLHNCCGALPANICGLASFVPASFFLFHHWAVSSLQLSIVIWMILGKNHAALVTLFQFTITWSGSA